MSDHQAEIAQACTACGHAAHETACGVVTGGWTWGTDGGVNTCGCTSGANVAALSLHEHDAAGCLDCGCWAGPPNGIACTCPPNVGSDLDSRREDPDGAPDHRWQVTTPEEVYDHD